MSTLKRKALASSFLLIIALFTCTSVHAVCNGGMFLNPVTDIYWPAMFPIKIGGIPIVPPMDGLPDLPDTANMPICICPLPPPLFVRIGIPVEYNEPSNFIEIVKDPFCFPFIGTDISMPSFLGGYYQGTVKGQTVDGSASSSFMNAHYAYFYPLAILDIITDAICLESKSAQDMDIAYLTEVDPLWRSDYLSMILNPESFLFANFYAQVACTADSVTSQVGYPLDIMFWCFGAQGSTYPLTGNAHNSKIEDASALMAERFLFKLGREGVLWNWGSSVLCTGIPMPILVKSNYKLQIAKPVAGMQSIPIGRSSMIWGMAKNPPSRMCDNFLYMLFVRRACCAL